MVTKPRLIKVVDEASDVRCVSGLGLIREEVWVDGQGEVRRYNLAFINHFLTRKDNGRVVGYDNSHGYHHRHFKGCSAAFEYVGYDDVQARFEAEVRLLREERA